KYLERLVPSKGDAGNVLALEAIATNQVFVRKHNPLPPGMTRSLERMIGVELHKEGIVAEIRVGDEGCQPLGHDHVLGAQRGMAAVKCVSIALRPRSHQAATAHQWARDSIGADAVGRVADRMLPAHVEFRIVYVVNR